jgi:hypothetical protein
LKLIEAASRTADDRGASLRPSEFIFTGRDPFQFALIVKYRELMRGPLTSRVRAVSSTHYTEHSRNTKSVTTRVVSVSPLILGVAMTRM